MTYFNSITQNEYKKIQKQFKITYGFGRSSFGNAMIAFTSKGVCCIEFYDKDYVDVFKRLQQNWKDAKFIQNNNKAQELLDEIFIKKEKKDLFVKGTNFQISVWKELLKIQYGKLCTYSDVANSINKPKSIRAVATAIGANHVGYLIPCHRVISKNGAMGGFRWGIDRKKSMIEYEQNVMKKRV